MENNSLQATRTAPFAYGHVKMTNHNQSTIRMARINKIQAKHAYRQ